MEPRSGPWLTLPNALTILRMVLTPFFGYFWWRHWFTLAIITFMEDLTLWLPRMVR